MIILYAYLVRFLLSLGINIYIFFAPCFTLSWDLISLYLYFLHVDICSLIHTVVHSFVNLYFPKMYSFNYYLFIPRTITKAPFIHTRASKKKSRRES